MKIIVDRTEPPMHPDWLKEALHKELELTGPNEYEISQIEQWLHCRQKNLVVSGYEMYEHIKLNGILEKQLNLADLEAIKSQGTEFFKKHFGHKKLFAWKSISARFPDQFYAPYLVLRSEEILTEWRWCNEAWYGNDWNLQFKQDIKTIH